jgi:AraC-like DNA-binding protein
MTNQTTALIIEDYVANHFTYAELAVKYHVHKSTVQYAIDRYFKRASEATALQSRINDNLEVEPYILSNWHILPLKDMASTLGYSTRHLQEIAASIGLLKKKRIITTKLPGRMIKPVKDHRSGREWESMTACCQELGIDHSTLARYIKGTRKNSRYSFAFVKRQVHEPTETI